MPHHYSLRKRRVQGDLESTNAARLLLREEDQNNRPATHPQLLSDDSIDCSLKDDDNYTPLKTAIVHSLLREAIKPSTTSAQCEVNEDPESGHG